jgi:hypothetical protein
MGRPDRSAHLHVQLSAAEKEMAREVALSRGCDLSEFVRELLRAAHRDQFGARPVSGRSMAT